MAVKSSLPMCARKILNPAPSMPAAKTEPLFTSSEVTLPSTAAYSGADNLWNVAPPSCVDHTPSPWVVIQPSSRSAKVTCDADVGAFASWVQVPPPSEVR